MAEKEKTETRSESISHLENMYVLSTWALDYAADQFQF